MTPPYNDGNGGANWLTWSKFVLEELKRLSKCHEIMSGDVVLIKIEIAKLKMKAGIWGLVGGAIPVIIGLAIFILKEGLK